MKLGDAVECRNCRHVFPLSESNSKEVSEIVTMSGSRGDEPKTKIMFSVTTPCCSLVMRVEK
jgi:hypothetical protein